MEIVSAKNRSFAQGLMGILNGSMAILGVMTGDPAPGTNHKYI